MKWPALFLFLLSQFLVSGQHPENASLKELVKTEEDFIQMAEEKNTRDAFLFFLADDAVTSVRGKGPRKGKTYLAVE